ncbi:MAG TPA: helix-turn-helix transcriptional regulator [Candidatus Limnocylindria bacterium]
MPSKERLAALGTRRGERLVREFADEVRAARLMSGLSQRSVGSAIGLSKSSVSRIELGRPPPVDLVTAARVARVVGLDLSVRCFPAAGPLRDEGHVRLIQRFLAELPTSVARQLEAPIRLPGDQRAWDVLLLAESKRIGVAAETRLRDLQALLRRERAKARDDGVFAIIVLVADTRANRRSLQEASPLLATELPLGTRQIMAAMRRGMAPTADGVVVA